MNQLCINIAVNKMSQNSGTKKYLI